MNVILFGGSFDPVHNGHLKIALNASSFFDAKVCFIPSKSPRWKSPNETIADRLEMLNIALRPYNEKFFIDKWEVENDFEITYSINTIRHFIETHPHEYENIYFLIGADQVNRFEDWGEAEEIAKLVQIIYYRRPEYEINEKIVKKYHMIEVIGKSIDISSTDIREFNRLDTPKEVIHYIIRRELYFVSRLKKYYDKKRFAHVVEVADLAYDIAKCNNLCPGDAYLSGLLHDVGKKIEPSIQKSYMEKYYPQYLDFLKPFCFHQFVGTQIAINDFGIKNQGILNAICYHCTGRGHMGPLEMIIYASDKIEPTRGFDSKELIKGCLKDYHQGFINVLRANREYFISKGKEFNNPLTNQCMDEYL